MGTRASVTIDVNRFITVNEADDNFFRIDKPTMSRDCCIYCLVVHDKRNNRQVPRIGADISGHLLLYKLTSGWSDIGLFKKCESDRAFDTYQNSLGNAKQNADAIDDILYPPGGLILRRRFSPLITSNSNKNFTRICF